MFSTRSPPNGSPCRSGRAATSPQTKRACLSHPSLTPPGSFSSSLSTIWRLSGSSLDGGPRSAAVARTCWAGGPSAQPEIARLVSASVEEKPRLFDLLTRRGATWTEGAFGFTGRSVRVPETFQEEVRECVRVTADEASAWYWQSGPNRWNPKGRHQFGPLRLPFPQAWIEWQVPETANWDGEEEPMLSNAQIGVLVETQEVQDTGDVWTGTDVDPGRWPWPPTAARIVIWTLIHTVGGRQPKLFPLTGGVVMDQDDRPLENRHLMPDPSAVHPDGVTDQEVDDMRRVSEAMWKVAFLAISLMNCKNIKLDRHTPVVRTTKKQRRPRPVGLEYHTIRRPAPARASLADKRAALGGDIPLHLVRGHFATYTADAPLFGKVTGTFWRDWHLRGRAERGIVLSDYQVGRRPDGPD